MNNRWINARPLNFCAIQFPKTTILEAVESHRLTFFLVATGVSVDANHIKPYPGKLLQAVHVRFLIIYLHVTVTF